MPFADGSVVAVDLRATEPSVDEMLQAKIDSVAREVDGYH
jgi:hypothetical protein